jgi:hypothetical protein
VRTLAFHFVRLANGVPTLRDGRAMPAVGEWLEQPGEIEICRNGLHASVRAIDALKYLEWDNAAACLVELDGVVESPGHDDKIVGSRRRVLGWAPCDELLRFFARECALSVAGYWEMPAIVRDYLETGDEDKRAAAGAAAWAAAGAAAGAAAWAAAGAAAWAAAGAAAGAAAWAAAGAAARAAAWDAAWDAAWAAARAAAGAAAGAAQNAILESLIVDAIGDVL